MSDVASMNVKQLKALIADAGLSAVGLTEKHELVALATEAAEKIKARGPNTIRPGRSEHTFGGWRCEVVAPEGPVKHVIVTLHGLGATNDDFIPFADHYRNALPGVMWVFPQAEVDAGLGVSAWWKFDLQEWMMSVMMQNEAALAKLIRKEHDGLPEARARGVRLVEEVMAATGVPLKNVHLSGFSQGAMTSMDIALSLPSPPGSIVMISGAPIVVDQWGEKLAKHAGKHNIFVSHGQTDQVV